MQKTATEWKYTIAITKAEKRGDRYVLVGEASGPEIDATSERMSEGAIELFHSQIESMVQQGNPLPLVDAHLPDGILREIGYVVSSVIDEQFHLVIEAELDMDNAAAQTLWTKLQKGRQYGLSIAGRVLDWADEWVESLSTTVRTYFNIVLSEISVTSRPAWQPSFGTVLSKSIDEAQASAKSDPPEGESASVTDEELQSGEQDATPPVTDDEVERSEEPVTDEQEAVERSCDCTEDCGCDAEKSDDEVGNHDADTGIEDETEEIERAGAKLSASTRQALLSQFNSLRDTLVELGVIEGDDSEEKSVSEDDESPVDVESVALAKALTDENTELKRSLDEANRRIEELEKTPPASVEPPVVTPEQVADAEEALKALPPQERLRALLALKTGQTL